jgi:hypothetical protein
MRSRSWSGGSGGEGRGRVGGMSDIRLTHGDCLEVLASLPADSLDACVTDPPYGLEFMGKEWDKALWRTDRTPDKTGRGSWFGDNHDSPRYGGKPQEQQAWHTEWAAEVYRVLKPGAYLLAFGGSRTYHRMACAVEDAGFEIRDCIQWLYGSGFPKSLNLDGDRAGWGTALKPAHEPIIVARKPLVGTVAQNVAKYGTGALNIDAARIGYTSEADKEGATPQGKCTAKAGALAGGTQHDGGRDEFERPELKGRWPANVIHDGSDEVLAAFAEYGEKGGGFGVHGGRGTTGTTAEAPRRRRRQPSATAIAAPPPGSSTRPKRAGTNAATATRIPR